MSQFENVSVIKKANVYFDGKVSILFWSYLAGLKSYLEEE